MTHSFFVRFRALLSLAIFLVMAPGIGLGDEKNFDYEFYVRLSVDESVVGSCPGPCATPFVPEVDLYFEGGFKVTGNVVSGSGTIDVRPQSECLVFGQNGGDAGASCRIAGVQSGRFTIGGRLGEAVVVDGDFFAPEMTLVLQVEEQPGLAVDFAMAFGGGAPQQVPVGHYPGSYQALGETSGLLESEFTVVAVEPTDWFEDDVGALITEHFEAGLELPAPGLLRTLKASGTLAFTRSPHRL